MKKSVLSRGQRKGWGESPHETARWAGGQWGEMEPDEARLDSDMKALVPLWGFWQGRQRTVLLGERRRLGGAACGVPPAPGPGVRS